MTQARPTLTVDVNMGGPGGRNIANKAAAQARASAQAPSMQQAGGGGAVRPGDIISEEDLMAQGGFSSDEDGQDEYESEQGRKKSGTNYRRQKQQQQQQQHDGQNQGPNGEVSIEISDLRFFSNIFSSSTWTDQALLRMKKIMDHKMVTL